MAAATLWLSVILAMVANMSNDLQALKTYHISKMHLNQRNHLDHPLYGSRCIVYPFCDIFSAYQVFKIVLLSAIDAKYLKSFAASLTLKSRKSAIGQEFQLNGDVFFLSAAVQT